MQVAVGMVVAIRLVVFGISQPPSAAVGRLPRALLAHSTLHGVLGAATTTVGGTSHVNNQVGLLRVVVDVLLHRVVHDGPVVLVARRPDLVARGTRVDFSGPPDTATVRHTNEFARRVSRSRQLGYFTVFRAALAAIHCCLHKTKFVGLR